MANAWNKEVMKHYNKNKGKKNYKLKDAMRDAKKTYSKSKASITTTKKSKKTPKVSTK